MPICQIFKNYNNMEPQGRVLPLIWQDQSETDTFVLNESTLEHLKSFSGPFAFLAVCGDYRSGKSCLLNWLFLQGRGFATSPLPSACTRGINIWSAPIQANGVNMWIVDTEGFGSLEKDSCHDGRIFLMSLLLSNIVLYNSVGAIDENAIQKLSMICREAKLLDESIPETKLFWVLRDFSLKMVDKHGAELAPNQYLEECLREGKQRNEKEFLRGLFRQRHCFPLIRPVIDESKLGTLQEADKAELRQQFQTSIKQLSQCLMQAVSPKSINGVPIGSHNLDILLKNLVSIVNQGSIDSNLETTYEKIKQFEQSLKKQQIIQAIQSKIQSVSKLFPVQKHHLEYLRQQTLEIINKQLKKMEEYSPKKELQVIDLQIKIWLQKKLSEVQEGNRNLIGRQIKDYLYRQLVESYPKLIQLSNSQFQPKYLQFLQKLREEYQQKYRGYFIDASSMDAYFSQFVDREEKKLFFELAKRWKLAQKELEERVEDLKRSKKAIEQEGKRLKEDRERLLESLEQARRGENKALQQIKLSVEEAFKEQARNIARQYDQRLQESKSGFSHQLSYLKQSLQAAMNSNSQLKAQFQYEKQSLLEKLAVERQKSDLAVLRSEQARNNQQIQNEKIRNQLQNRLRISELKLSDLQSTLSNERRKFQLISEERRAQQVKIMQELSEKNERIDILSEQLFQLEERYERELDRILTEEKEILCSTLSAKMSEYDLRCRNYESKLHQLESDSSERDFFEKKCEQIELQSRQLRSRLEEQQDKVALLSSRIKKLQSEARDREAHLAQLKTQHERELAMLAENIQISRRFLKEAEERQSQQNQWLKNRNEALLRENNQAAARRLQQSLQLLKCQLELKFSKERDQLKQIIKNSYDEVENLRIDSVTLVSQLQKINQILHKTIKQSTRQSSTEKQYQLTEIVQSPEQNSETGKQQSQLMKRGYYLKNTEYLAQEVEELVVSLREELSHLLKQRGNAREELRNTSEELQTYQKALIKLKQQNKGLKLEHEELRKKISISESCLEELTEIRERCSAHERENQQLKRQFILKDQLLSSREENYRQNIGIYKETVSTLTEENKRLSQSLRQLSQSHQQSQNELQRFKIWATEIKLKQTEVSPSAPLSSEKIKEMEAEIKRLARRLQDEKLQKLQRQTKKQINLHSDILAENRSNQVESLRKENMILTVKLEQMRDLQLRLIDERRSSKSRQLEIEEQRTLAAREELQSYKRKAKEAISILEQKLQISLEENKGLKQQLLSMEQAISQQQSFAFQLLEHENAQLKIEKQRLLDYYNQRISEQQASQNSKAAEAERRAAQAEQRLQDYRQQLAQEHNRIILESERHRLKYQHLLKVNGQLIKQIESLKSKAHQLTIREKYKSKISSLFND